jgi:hypothetical protein
MHHPALHGDDYVPHPFPQASLAQGMNAARRKRKINRPSSAYANLPHVGTAFENLHRKSTLPQEYGQQGAVQAGANQSDFIGNGLHGSVKQKRLMRVASRSSFSEQCPRFPQFREEFFVQRQL